MKTLVKKLRFGVLLTGFVIVTSCGNNFNVVATVGINAFKRTVPVLAVSATKLTGEKISKYFKNSSAEKKDNELTDKKVNKAGRNRRVMPISIGQTGARLDSSNSRQIINVNKKIKTL